jgi:hypothetical protein
MKVYCLFESIPYEGDWLVGIFFKEEDGKAELQRMKLGLGEQKYHNDYTYLITEWRVK